MCVHIKVKPPSVALYALCFFYFSIFNECARANSKIVSTLFVAMMIMSFVHWAHNDRSFIFLSFRYSMRLSALQQKQGKLPDIYVSFYHFYSTCYSTVTACAITTWKFYCWPPKKNPSGRLNLFIYLYAYFICCDRLGNAIASFTFIRLQWIESQSAHIIFKLHVFWQEI